MSATADWFERAAVELAATSERQVEWAHGVAADRELLALIDELPREHRQPSLLFAVAAWCGAPPLDYPDWREWVVAHWREVSDAARARRTQTNEVGRCIPLLVALDRIPGPIALLELGASAGLCLALDRYRYRFDEGPVLGPVFGPVFGRGGGASRDEGGPMLTTETSGVGSAPTRMPELVWRRGIDLHPLSPADPEDRRWLEALLPPDRPARLARLHAALAAVADDPPLVLRGDALGSLAAVAALAADEVPDATLVVASLGTLVYLPPSDRAALAGAVRRVGGRLVTFEAAGALPGVLERMRGLSAPHPTPFVLALDGWPLAHARAHGDGFSWLSQASAAGQPELPGTAT